MAFRGLKDGLEDGPLIASKSSAPEFEIVKTIGRGAFGVVTLCRGVQGEDIFALKQVNIVAKGESFADAASPIKDTATRPMRTQQALLEVEALLRAQETNQDWAVGLRSVFQDSSRLYLVMDYLPGGDLVTHLQRLDTFTQAEASFYCAELVQAVDFVHTVLGFIHRDIKPDNIVFDARGHIHLVDFGCCRRLHREGSWREPACGSIWGAPPYVAPEVQRREEYGEESDLWSVGVIAYQMLFGGPPFVERERDPAVVATRVMRWPQFFVMPACPSVGEGERDFISRLVCEPKDRMSVTEIRRHRFFRGLDFSRLRDMDPPIMPKVAGRLDTSNFDHIGVDTQMMFSSLASCTTAEGGSRQVTPPGASAPYPARTAPAPTVETASREPASKAHSASGTAARPMAHARSGSDRCLGGPLAVIAAMCWRTPRPLWAAPRAGRFTLEA